MRKTNHIISWLLLVTAVLIPGFKAKAQLHGAVTVEGDYLPDIIHPDRINMHPGIMRYKAVENTLPYQLEGVTISAPPSFLPMGPTLWGATQELPSYRGYLDISAGSWLNTDLSAGYRIINDGKHSLGVRFQHNSSSLWQPYPDISPRRFNYQESIGADYSQRCGSAGIFSASMQYHLGYFNYYGIKPTGSSERFPDQTLNDIAFRLGWSSVRYMSRRGSEYDLSLSGRIFNYRIGTRETDLRLGGSYLLSLSENSSAGFDADLDVLLYGSSAGISKPDNYGSFSLNPYYELSRNNMLLKLGAKIYITANADGRTVDTHYPFFHIAPDIRFSVRGNHLGFYAGLQGDSELMTIAYLSDMDPYTNPELFSTQPVYTPLDARIELEFGPLHGFSAGIEGSFRHSSHVRLGGWYSVLGNYGHIAIPGLDTKNSAPAYGTGLETISLTGVSVGLRLKYDLSGTMTLSAGGFYQPQNGKRGIFNGLDRPRWIADAEFRVNPYKPLSTGIKLKYRGVRTIYTTYELPGYSGVIINGGEGIGIAGLRLPDILNLDFNAEWTFSPKFSLTFNADNLLNRKETLLPCLGSEGIIFMGGVNLKF